MASLKTHTIQSIAGSAALYPVLGANVVPFGLACVLIDLDHVLAYVQTTRSAALHGVFPFSKLIEINHDKGFLVLSAFHTAEAFLLVGMLGFLHPVFLYILAGMAFHMAADFVHMARAGCFFVRALSLIEYRIRKKNPNNITSFYRLIEREDLATGDIPDIGRWLERWRKSGKASRGKLAN